MKQLNYNYTPNEIERLFIEKGLESLYKGTLDSYRVRLNNTKTIVEEIINVTQQVKDRILQRKEYVTEVRNEAKELINKEPESLMWTSISKDFYVSKILGESKKKFNYLKIIQASKLVLFDNQNFASEIIEKIEIEITDFSVGEEVLNREMLLCYCHFYIIELMNIGYSKQYLYQFFRTIFVHTGDNAFNFLQRFQYWKNLHSQDLQEYQVIYNLISKRFQFRELKTINANYEQVNRKFRAKLPATTSQELRDYLETNKQEKLVAIKVDAADHYKAIEISRLILSKDLDLYHSGFNGINNIIDKQAGVMSISSPEKASTEPSNYQLDGFTRGNHSILSSLVSKVATLRNNNVSDESINKLLAGFRYLRMGTESSALETKLLNYLKWNISRLYRLRNEIVHNAAIKDNIQSNVSHIRYYLTFTLYSILSFLAESPVDTNNDGLVSIEDYFITQEIKLANMKGKTIGDYTRINNPMEMFY